MTLTKRAKQVKAFLGKCRDVMDEMKVKYEVCKMQPDQTVPEFLKAMKGKPLVLCTSHELVAGLSDNEDACVAVINCDLSQASGIFLTDDERSLKRLRLMLTKRHAGKPRECIVCMEVIEGSSTTCMKCWDSVCMTCVAKTALHNGRWTHACPSCRNKVDLCTELGCCSQIELNRWPDLYVALTEVVPRFETKKMQVTILSEDMVGSQYVVFANGRKLRFLNGKTPSKKVLDDAAVILVGDLPSACDCCGRVNEGDLESGVLLKVTIKDHDIVEKQGMFAPYSVCAARELGLIRHELDWDSESEADDERLDPTWVEEVD